jgi:succinate dehydrogenase/fumarate reductase flavoprotein subunit
MPIPLRLDARLHNSLASSFHVFASSSIAAAMSSSGGSARIFERTNHRRDHMRLVIIGAGFAGMYAALSAARLRDIQGVSPEELEIALVRRSRRWWSARGSMNRSPRP